MMEIAPGSTFYTKRTSTKDESEVDKKVAAEDAAPANAENPIETKETTLIDTDSKLEAN